ncbi:hypothetical protein K3495_g15665 [Podosphaera aphanis]|nr:hypothetical protein K3495_g15665 [Podosphaera aphanis]
MVRRQNQRRAAPLRIMQVNVGRSSSAHDIALSIANENQLDIILIQEPWIFHDLSKQISKAHKAFESFSPLSTWHSRPRAFTYVRKGAKLRPFQVAADSSRDIVQILVTLGNNAKLPIWNIYNAPTGSEGAGEGLSVLLSGTDSPYFAGGDFNLRHPLWDSKFTESRSSCTKLIDWYGCKGLRLLNPTNTPTHNRGGTLDLAFCTDESATCEIRTDLHTTSDHETLVSTLCWDRRITSDSKLQYKALDSELFLKLLGNNQSFTAIRSLEVLRAKEHSYSRDRCR